MMKQWSVTALLAAFLLFQVLAPLPVTAGGVIKYHVKVKNEISDPPRCSHALCISMTG